MEHEREKSPNTTRSRLFWTLVGASAGALSGKLFSALRRQPFEAINAIICTTVGAATGACFENEELKPEQNVATFVDRLEVEKEIGLRSGRT